MAKIRIKDTGLNKVGGTKKYSTATDDWVDLDGFQLRHEFTVMSSDNQAPVIDDGKLTFTSNEITGIQAPRLTMQGVIATADINKLQLLLDMRRTLGIKEISGGAGIIPAYPGAYVDDYNCIAVILKNVTMSEVVKDGTEYANITIQMEQVN